MPSYTAEFRTDADYATHAFKARSPGDALTKARAFHDARTEELMFQNYDGGHPVNEIAVHDAEREVVTAGAPQESRLYELIEKGAMGRAVSEITIAGNLNDMFARMVVANDLEYKFATNAPTIMIEGMTIAGR